MLRAKSSSLQTSMPCNEFFLNGYKIEEPDRFMSKRENVGLKYCIFCAVIVLNFLEHCLLITHNMRQLLDVSDDWKKPSGWSSRGKHVPWEIPLFSGLLSMFDIRMAELGRRRCSRWLFDTKLDIFPLFPPLPLFSLPVLIGSAMIGATILLQYRTL